MALKPRDHAASTSPSQDSAAVRALADQLVPLFYKELRTIAGNHIIRAAVQCLHLVLRLFARAEHHHRKVYAECAQAAKHIDRCSQNSGPFF
jgi:hypothetical protein